MFRKPDEEFIKEGAEKVTPADIQTVAERSEEINKKFSARGPLKRFIEDGKVLTVQSGEMKLLEEDVTMEDGTQVKVDGTIVLTDGTRRRMKEGESLYPGRKPAETASIPEMGSSEEKTGTETHDPS